MKKRVFDYAKGVISGNIVANELVKLSAKRSLADVESERYYFDVDAVKDVVVFLSYLKLNTVPKRPFILEDWQLFIVANIYGIKIRDTGLRKYRYAYIEVPRKNGKSELITALGLYHYLFDTDAVVTVSANSREQVKNVDFKKIKEFAHQLDPKEKFIVSYYNSLRMVGKPNEILVTSSDAKRLDGLNISTAIIDELHAAPDGSVYDVIKSAMGSREEPLLIVITTAGFDTDGFCYQLRTHVVNVLNNVVTDEAQFGIIYTLDEWDSIENESVWVKANPNLGVSLNIEFLRNEVNKAISNQSEGAGVKVKNFNLWQKKSTEKQWIGDLYLSKAMVSFDLNKYKGAECVIGVDLGTNTDICALSVCIKTPGNYVFFTRYYLPEHSLNTHTNKKRYKDWANNGYITITSGNVTDYSVILNDLLELKKMFRIRQVNYDKYNATQWAIDATNAGLILKPFSQNTFNYNIPTKEFERLILQGKMLIEPNPITKWMLDNVVIRFDANGNAKPIRLNEEKKIDGVMAMLMALGGFVGKSETNFVIV